MNSYEIIDGPKRDDIVGAWRNRLRSKTELGIKERLIRPGMVLVGDSPSDFPSVREEDAKRSRARVLSMAPVREAQRQISADGTVSHHIVRERRSPRHRNT